MIPSAHVIKRTAKSQLKNNWVPAIVVAVLFMLVVNFFGVLLGLMISFFYGAHKLIMLLRIAISVIYGITVFSVVIPLFHGMLRWFWYLGLEKKLSIGTLFYYFSEGRLYIKSLSFYMLLLGKILMLTVLCVLPAAVVRILPEILERFLLDVDSYGMLFYFASMVLLILGFAVAFVLSMQYFSAPVLAIIGEEKEIEEILTVSRELQLSKASCVVFIASFLGWIAISYLGVPLLYTIPYFLVSYVVAIRFAVTNHRYDMSRWGLPPLI